MNDTGRETITKNKFSKSIGTGIGSLTSGGREYYILEHKTSSKNFHAGQQKEIIVDYIELGRDPRCAIRYSEQDTTVSRKHAAIEKEGDNWVLLNFSDTNPTLLNGRPVNRRYYLYGGDEIQLSLEGPRLGFIIPQNNKTGSLSIGKRMGLFGQQALRPYKRTIAGLASLLVLISLVSGYAIYRLKNENIEIQDTLTETQQALEDSVSISAERAALLMARNQDLVQRSEADQRRISDLTRRMNRAASSRPLPSNNTSGVNANIPKPAALDAFSGDIFQVSVTNLKISYPNSDLDVIELDNISWSGTGFLTSDNRFITTRQVVQPWFYLADSNMIGINVFIHNYGAKLDLTYVATSSKGKKFTFMESDFNIDNRLDKANELPNNNQSLVVRHARDNPKDIAWAKLNQKGKLELYQELSQSLPTSQRLYTLGYPLRMGAFLGRIPAPNFQTGTVSSSGLNNGFILSSGDIFDGAFSGAPVLIKNNDSYKVIGVLSVSWNPENKRIIPIQSIY